jgi:hypothetical protein
MLKHTGARPMTEKLSLDRVVHLAQAGETFTLNGATVPLDDLIAIATAASRSKAMIRLRGLSGRPLEELMRITVASQGRVILDDEVAAPRIKPPARRGWFGLRAGSLARPAGGFPPPGGRMTEIDRRDHL